MLTLKGTLISISPLSDNVEGYNFEFTGKSPIKAVKEGVDVSYLFSVYDDHYLVVDVPPHEVKDSIDLDKNFFYTIYTPKPDTTIYEELYYAGKYYVSHNLPDGRSVIHYIEEA